MSEYRNLRGKRIKTFATDLGNAQAEGQVFLVSGENPDKLKTVVASSAWSSGANLGSGRYGLGASGSQTAALGFAGYGAPSPGYSESQKTEEFILGSQIKKGSVIKNV